MLRRLLFLMVCSLSFMLHTPETALAQRQKPRVEIGRDQARAVQDTLRSVDRERRERALQWAAERNLPLRVRQSDGRTIELVDVAGNRPVYRTSLNQFAAGVTGTVYLRAGQRLGLNLTGKDMLIGLWDAGRPLADHQEFNGRIEAKDGAKVDNHATHVAGTLMAKGVRPEAQGMAYEARIAAYDWNGDASEMSAEAEKGMLVSNHSYGSIAGWYYGNVEETGDQWYWFGDPNVSADEDYIFGTYEVDAAQFDRAVALNPYYLPVVAAGNDRVDSGPASGFYRALDAKGDWRSVSVSGRMVNRDGGEGGYDTIAGAGVAKNVLTIGSISVDESRKAHLSVFSSFGPTDDGRIKPDLVGYGERVFSSVSDGPNKYGYSTGTSMATPNITGSLLLLQQHYHNLTGNYMRAATLKGLVIHTATDVGNPGPDYQSGWGLLNAEAAAIQIGESLVMPLAATEEVIETGDTRSWNVRVEEAGPLRITLSWTDRASTRLVPALNNPEPHLRNDLDVRVISESTGEVFLPYHLDPRNPDRWAASGDNTVDPVEQVYLPRAEVGAYTVVVSSKRPLYSGAAQPFSIFVSGATDALRTVAVAGTDAETTVDQVSLHWETVFERSQGIFRIERSEITYDARNNKQIGPAVVVGTVETRGSAGEAQDYAFKDTGMISGRYLYQIIYQTQGAEYVVSEIEVNLPPPEQLAVISSYPNPFAERTTVVLDLPEKAPVTAEVFDVLGRSVAFLIDEELPAGRHELAVDGSQWSPGVYFVRVSTSRRSLSHRMVVVR